MKSRATDVNEKEGSRGWHRVTLVNGWYLPVKSSWIFYEKKHLSNAVANGSAKFNSSSDSSEQSILLVDCEAFPLVSSSAVHTCAHVQKLCQLPLANCLDAPRTHVNPCCLIPSAEFCACSMYGKRFTWGWALQQNWTCQEEDKNLIWEERTTSVIFYGLLENCCLHINEVFINKIHLTRWFGMTMMKQICF